MSSRLNPLRISLIYVVVGAAWILASDYVAAGSFLPVGVQTAQTIKGLFYIAVTGALVYALTRRLVSDVQRAERRMRILFDNTPDALFVLDDDRKIVAVNGVAIDRYGYERDRMLSMSVTELIAPQLREGLADRLRAILEDDAWTESKHMRSDGSVFPVEIRARSIELEGNTRVLTSVRDITDRKRAETELRTKSDALENSLNGFNIVDSRGKFVYANRAYLKMWRYDSLDEILDSSFTSHFADSSVPMKISDALRNRGECTAEFTARRKDGTTFEVLMNARLSHNEQGEEVYHGTSIDITERKRALEALRESEHRYRTYVDASPVSILITDPSWRITDVNRAACHLLGYDRSELVGMTPQDFAIDDLGEVDALFDKLASSGVMRTELRVRKHDGSRADLAVEAVALGDNEYMAFALDVSERVALEKQLRQAQKMEAVGQLAGGIAHDFNNLLQAISGYTDLLLNEVAEGTETHEMLSEIAHSGQRAARLVGQLLAFSRRQVMNPEAVDLNDTIEKLLKMLGRVIPEHIKIDFVPGHSLGRVFADRGMVEQLLMNLCVNARDAMPDGGKLKIETENVLIDADYCHVHPWAKVGRYVLLSVTDTGHGMDREIIEHIFEPFFTTKALGVGTGLGLATVYGIVKQHDGLINVYSEPGKGTAFKIYLAVTERRAGEVGSKVEGQVKGGTETVLLAEDDESVRELARRILERAGYTVLVADNGGSAMTVFQEHVDEVQLLLLDVVMPGLSGRTVLEQARAMNPDVPVLFASGYSEDAIHTNFVLDAGIRLIQKPFSRDALLRAVREAIDEVGEAK